MTAGYSGTPLAKKLTLRHGQRCWFLNMPGTVREEIEDYGLELVIVGEPEEGTEAVHIFVTDGTKLANHLAKLRTLIAKDGQVWVSWPKKGSGMETALDQGAVQRLGLDAGFVDIKKCAIDEIWSGLKFVIPKVDR
ncbi:MAG: DUF3052 family protein [Erythrobacter sp.]|uniref:DUF3052 family protein n=1 Tax=Erythrobacter sp. TaxID=1042 RepID=UPI00326337E2